MKRFLILALSFCLGLAGYACSKKIFDPPLIPKKGSIVVASNPIQANVYLDSVFHGTTPDSIPDLDPGDYKLKITFFQHHDWQEIVAVKAGEVTRVNVQLKLLSGSLIVTSTPAGATIWLGGVNTGRITPDTITDLDVGIYQLRLTLNNYQDYNRSVTIDSKEPVTAEATLVARCPGNIIGDLSKPPEIGFTNISDGAGRIYGWAKNVDASKTKVVLWALTNMWYVQPYITSPYTSICGDGNWTNVTHSWRRMVALLVDGSYQPGSTRITHPGLDPGVLAWVEYPPVRPDMPVNFSGEKWGVKLSEDRFDPGPNYWSASVDNAWVDDDGMHLKITSDEGKWKCAEVHLLRSLGYGTYTIQLASRVDSLDPNTVFGIFLYENLERELDIEFSKALANPNNAQYVVQPYNVSGNLTRFNVPSVTYSTHQIVWQSDRIEFRSWRGLESSPTRLDLINEWIYTGANIPPPGDERFRFNLWLFGGRSPATSRGDEVVIRSFSYSH